MQTEREEADLETRLWGTEQQIASQGHVETRAEHRSVNGRDRRNRRVSDGLESDVHLLEGRSWFEKVVDGAARTEDGRSGRDHKGPTAVFVEGRSDRSGDATGHLERQGVAALRVVEHERRNGVFEGELDGSEALREWACHHGLESRVDLLRVDLIVIAD